MIKAIKTIPPFLVFLALLLSAMLASASEKKSSGVGGQSELKNFLQSVRDRSAEVTSYQSSFIQEKHMAMFDRPVVFKGKLSIVRPNKLRWEFTEPVPSILIFNGNRGIRCNGKSDPLIFQLDGDSVMRSVGEQLQFWISGDYTDADDRYVLTLQRPATLVVKPSSFEASEYISTVTIRFNREGLQPEEVEILERGGDRTRIIFQDQVINGILPDNLFLTCGFDG